ncbi:hypothetical protein HPB52_015800 [Rhipicephalus sanguineus]|uniref:Uncharacterized protein n=1 Tax=Rhipicephalus sanguineus TaxID=34632 RepID=A0A9D4SZ39_RHISA|nr:hypothetical protein HPB52_015800 [Rhipicephalus sanguineus]
MGANISPASIACIIAVAEGGEATPEGSTVRCHRNAIRTLFLVSLPTMSTQAWKQEEVDEGNDQSGSQVIQWKSTYNPLLDVTTVSDMAMSPNRAMDNSVARSVPERMITKTALRGIIQNVQTAMETT